MSKFLDRAKSQISRKVVPFEVEGEKFEARELSEAHFEILAFNHGGGVAMRPALVALSIYNSKGTPEFGIEAYPDLVEYWGPQFAPFVEAAVEANSGLAEKEEEDLKKP